MRSRLSTISGNHNVQTSGMLVGGEPINRYSIGSVTPSLKRTLMALWHYVSPRFAGKGKEGNWLPARKGPFWMCSALTGRVNRFWKTRTTCLL
jgi:hypothetical protein